MATKTFTQFRKDSVVTSIPVSLPYGEEAYYKDANGRLTLYVGDESGDAQLAVPTDYPARIVNVFGGAPNVAPNFDTVASAITYANSLTPSTANPVVIRLFSKTDNTPYDLTGQDFFTLNASGIYIQSSALGYIDAPVVTTLPTTLEAGRRVWYKDGNGMLTEWVGNADGEAWPAVGYKEYTALVSYISLTITVTTRKNDLGNVVWTRSGDGAFVGTLNGAFANNDWGSSFYYETRQVTAQDGENQYILYLVENNSVSFANFIDDVLSDASVVDIPISIRIYP